MGDVIFCGFIFLQEVKSLKISIQGVYIFQKNFQGFVNKNKYFIWVMKLSKASFFQGSNCLRFNSRGLWVNHSFFPGRIGFKNLVLHTSVWIKIGIAYCVIFKKSCNTGNYFPHFSYVVVIARCRMQYGKYLPSLSYFATYFTSL